MKFLLVLVRHIGFILTFNEVNKENFSKFIVVL